jgi:predicted nucleic acid-binding protein
MLESVERLKMQIVWSHIIEMQFLNLKSGINKVGISDLIIAQNALQHQVPVLSLDKHFKLMKENLGLQIYE